MLQGDIATLPNYRIPKYHGPSGIREFDDNALLLMKPNNAGELTIEGEDGEFKIGKKEDIPKLFPRRFNWTYSPLGEWECIFRFFKRDQLFELKELGILEFGDYQLHWIIGTDKMRLTKDNDTKSSRYLINVAPRLVKGFQADTLDKLKFVVDKLIELNNYIPLNITSNASTTKDLLLAVGGDEFSLLNKLPLDIIHFIHSCSVGPRMESRCLGTIDGVDNRDMVRAYLRGIGKTPSLARGHLLKVERGTSFSEDAHPGSSYEIRAKVPDTYTQFGPLPVRKDSHISYPHGEFITRVSKPYIDLLNELGDIPYEILDSVQFIMWGKPHYPFAELSQTIEKFENAMQEYFYPINLKTLHYSLVGHMLHYHKNVNFTTGKTTYETSQDFNPIDACGIQGTVAAELWKFSQMNETEAIRVDALSGYNLPNRNGYKEEPSGLMTFLTPGLKDKPNKSLYRDLIERDRDLRNVMVRFPLRLGVKKAYYQPHKIGRVVTYITEISPLGGGRGVEDIKRVGDLLERRIPLSIPNTRSWEELPNRGNVDWLDVYLNWYPQTRT